MTTTTKIVLGIVGAAAAGVVIGLLIAPEKGDEMRRRVKKTAGEWADQLSNLFVGAKDEVKNQVDSMKERVRQAKNDTEEKISRLKETM